MNEAFTWPAYPQSEEDFEALMRAVDVTLSDKGFKPSQRPMHVPRLFWEALGWSGDVLPSSSLSESAGYKGEVLMAKAHCWYKQNYGEKLKFEFAVGFVPFRLGNAIWRVRIGVIYGAVQIFIDRNLQNTGVTLASRGAPATYNALSAVEDLPQALVDNIGEAEIKLYHQFYLFAYENLQWHSELPTSELLRVARNDYAASTGDLLAGRYGQARWGAQQAVEKTIKGLLALAGTNYPTGGRRGHDLIYLGDLLDKNHGIRIQHSHLMSAGCSPRLRYGEEPSSEAQAMTANHAVLMVFNCVRTNPEIAAIVTN